MPHLVNSPGNPQNVQLFVDKIRRDSGNLTDMLSNFKIWNHLNRYDQIQQYDRYRGQYQTVIANPDPTILLVRCNPREVVGEVTDGVFVTPVPVVSQVGNVASVVSQEIRDWFGDPLSLTGSFANYNGQACWDKCYPRPHQARQEAQRLLQKKIAIGTSAGLSIFPKALLPEFKAQVGRTRKPTLELGGFTTTTPTIDPVVAQVRADQLGCHSRIFLYRTYLEVLNQTTLEFEPISLIRIGMFGNMGAAIKGNKRRAFLKTFMDQVYDGTLERYFDAQGFRERLEARAGMLIRYTTGLSDILGNDVGSIQYQDAVQETLTTGQYCDQKVLCGIDAASKINSSEESRIYLKTKQALDSIGANVADFGLKLLQADRLIVSNQQKVAQYTSMIENLRVDSEAQLSEKARVGLQLTEYEAQVPAVRERTTKAKEILDQYIGRVIQEGVGSSNWFEAFQQNNCIVNDITYSVGGVHTTLRQDPGVAAREGSILQLVQFTTLKPSLITPDDDPTKNVVGGPWNIRLENQGSNTIVLKVKPASTASVFGWIDNGSETVTLRWHPHTNGFTVRKNPEEIQRHMTTSWTAACQGNISSSLYQAFHNKDPRLAIYIALAWLTSANSTDAWGAYYRTFPTPGQINWSGEARTVVVPTPVVLPVEPQDAAEVNVLLGHILDTAYNTDDEEEEEDGFTEEEDDEEEEIQAAVQRLEYTLPPIANVTAPLAFRDDQVEAVATNERVEPQPGVTARARALGEAYFVAPAPAQAVEYIPYMVATAAANTTP